MSNTSLPADVRTEDRASHLIERPIAVWLLMLVTSSIVFSPFLLSGQVILASTDTLFDHYPNLLFGLEAVRKGGLGLWNPYIFAGFDMSSSFHHHILLPTSWPLLLFDEKQVLYAVTFRNYVEFFLIGVLGYYISGPFLATKWGRVFFAVVLQLGSFTSFTYTAYIGSHLFLATLASIYVILTIGKRAPAANFAYLVILFTDILLIGHVGYILAFGIPIIICYVAVLWPDSVKRPWSGRPLLVLAAGALAMGIAAYRLVPVIWGLLFEQTALAGYELWSAPNSGYFAVTTWIPEAWGPTLTDSQRISKALDLGSRHIQFHRLPYFGAVPIALVVLALFGRLGARTRLWAGLFVVAAVAFTIAIQPLRDVFDVLVGSEGGGLILRVLLAFLAFAVLLAVIRQLPEQLGHISDREIKGYILVCVVAVLVAGALWAKFIQNGVEAWATDPLLLSLGVGFSDGRLAAELTRGLSFGMAVVLLVGVALMFAREFDLRRVRRWTIAFAVLAVAAAVAVGAWATWLDLFQAQPLLRQTYVFVTGGIAWSVLTVVWLRAVAAHGEFRPSTCLQLLAAAIAAGVILIIPWSPVGGDLSPATMGIMAFLGVAKFVLVAAVIMEIIVATRSGALNRRFVLPLVVLLSLGELLFFNKYNNNVGAVPFIDLAALYPTQSELLVETMAPEPGGGATIELANPAFSFSGGALTAWSKGGGGSQIGPVEVPRPDGLGAVEIRNEADDLATIFQDVPVPGRPAAVTFGAWVRAFEPGNAFVLLTSEGRAAQTPYHSGDGKWEWLSATIAPVGETVRPHIVVSGPGKAEAYGPLLVTGWTVEAGLRPRPPEADQAAEAAAARAKSPPPDFKKYRVSQPYRLLRLQPAEAMGNISSVFGLSTYGGVDSDVKRSLRDFIAAFDPAPGILHRAGVLAALANPRALDLLGVRYDVDESGVVIARPDALARLSLFRDYQVAAGFGGMIERLKDPAFDPTRTILIDRDPGWPPAAPRDQAPRFEALDFTATTMSEIEVPIAGGGPGILLFNDTFSGGWQATWNGSVLPVMHANANFMAVSLPGGEGTLGLRFRPAAFYGALWVSAIVLLAAIVLAGFLFVRDNRARRRPVPA